jgi:hypothetical protein
MSDRTRRPHRPIFVLRLRAAPGRDPIRALRALLKHAWRRLGLRAIAVSEERDPAGGGRTMTVFVTGPADADADPLLGLQVMMPGACSKCRHRMAVIGHATALTCARCRHARGRLAKQEADFINNIISTFGGPTAPIVLRQSTGIRAVGASPDADLHQHPEVITMSDEFLDTDLDTPTENDLNLAYGSKYLGTIDLGDRKVRARIQKVRKEELTDKDGRKKLKFLIFFDALDKPLVLNATNKDRLVAALGRDPAKWKGASVGVSVDPDVSFGGKRTGGVRLKVLEPAKPAKTSKSATPKQTPASEFPEEAGDPGFEPDQDFDQAAE